MFQCVTPEANPDDPTKRGQTVSFYHSPAYSWSCEAFPPSLQLYHLRHHSAITNRVESYLCFCWLLFFYLTVEVQTQEVFDNPWNSNKNSIRSLFLGDEGKWEKEASSLLFTSSELLDQLSMSLFTCSRSLVLTFKSGGSLSGTVTWSDVPK